MLAKLTDRGRDHGDPAPLAYRRSGRTDGPQRAARKRKRGAGRHPASRGRPETPGYGFTITLAVRRTGRFAPLRSLTVRVTTYGCTSPAAPPGTGLLSLRNTCTTTGP